MGSLAFSATHQRTCGTGIWRDRDIFLYCTFDHIAALRYWNLGQQRHYPGSAPCRQAMPVSADPVAEPAAHTRAESRGSLAMKAVFGERQTLRWREMDSNFQFRDAVAWPDRAALVGAT